MANVHDLDKEDPEQLFELSFRFKQNEGYDTNFRVTSSVAKHVEQTMSKPHVTTLWFRDANGDFCFVNLSDVRVALISPLIDEAP